MGIAQLFIKVGAKVVFSDINKSGKAAADTAGENTIFIECDISNTESVKNLVATIIQAFGTIDILINNAGILHQKPISVSLAMKTFLPIVHQRAKLLR